MSNLSGPDVSRSHRMSRLPTLAGNLALLFAAHRSKATALTFRRLHVFLLFLGTEDLGFDSQASRILSLLSYTCTDLKRDTPECVKTPPFGEIRSLLPAGGYDGFAILTTEMAILSFLQERRAEGRAAKTIEWHQTALRSLSQFLKRYA